ncbi:MAG TPA: ion transporter [Persephonella sp.]|uniref:BK channel n=1 Tax=Persephonella marina (strain DSM 14350 / EX-H1) TaxID=123214 RepID=C0QQD6_PERMH|nr:MULTISPECIES: ion transporter [Persephonella]ACO03400.1 putative potassium channel protein [Persephonella marina EX-H1]HCB69512.1 ion transporter [Persephonella sp.]
MRKIIEEREKLKLQGRVRVFKIWLYNILENENSPYNQIYNVFALFIVITSSIGVLIELTPLEAKLPPDLDIFLRDYEEVVLIFFVVEYLTRLWVVSNFTDDFKRTYFSYESPNKLSKLFFALKEAFRPKVQWMKTPYAIIDLLSILPIIRPLRAFRILRVLRLLKIIRYGGAIKSFIFAIKEQAYLFLFIFFTIITWIVILSLLVYIFEYNAGNELFVSMWHAIYWGIVTISTVGFGDIHPVTDPGRIITSIMIGGGIVLVAALTGTFSAALVSRLMTLKEGGLKMENLENHIVICGWNETAEEIMEQILSMKIEKEKPVVIVTNLPKSAIGIELPRDVFYKRGDFIQENILTEVGIEKAEHVVIVAEREEGLSERNIDARTALASMLIKTLNPNAHLYVEVLLDEDADIFQKRMRVREVIIHGQILGKIMFTSILNPGATSLIKTLVDKERGIKKVKITGLGKFENFGQLLMYTRKYGYLPVAVERRGKIHLNPKDTFILEKEDFVFLIPAGGGED